MVILPSERSERVEDLLLRGFSRCSAAKRCLSACVGSSDSVVRQYYAYILSSKSRNLYVGVTNSLARRMWEHKNDFSQFTARYRINRLVYFEVFRHPMAAIIREKQMKRLSRAEKIALIEIDNPLWNDLAADWF